MKRIVSVAPAFLAVVLAMHSPDAAADCMIAQPNSSSYYIGAQVPYAIGQSFTACETGYVTSVSFTTNEATSGPIALVLGSGTIPETHVTYSQPLTPVAGANTAALSTPFPVVSGTSYFFALQPSADVAAPELHYGGGDPYAGGSVIFWDGYMWGPWSTDLTFGVGIEVDPVATQPTTWGGMKVLYR
jgi:hypothetical protein